MGPGSRSQRSLVRDDGDRFDFQNNFPSWPGFVPAIHVFTLGYAANFEAVIARSEATKQSILPFARQDGLLRLARNDVKFQIRLRVPAARGARGFARTVRASIIRGRRECRVPNAPIASRAKLNKAHERSHHRYTGINPAFPAQWFTAYFVLSPATNSSCHRHPRIKVLSMPGWATSLRELSTSNGCQNDTSSPSAALRLSQRLRRAKRRSSACHSSAHGPYDPPCHPLTSPDAAASTASRPALVTTRDRPSVGRDGTTQ
jgi:hypothetical protein